jgi:hypothetical protein
MIGGGLTLVEVLMHLGWRTDSRVDAGPGREARRHPLARRDPA